MWEQAPCAYQIDIPVFQDTSRIELHGCSPTPRAVDREGEKIAEIVLPGSVLDSWSSMHGFRPSKTLSTAGFRGGGSQCIAKYRSNGGGPKRLSKSIIYRVIDLTERYPNASTNRACLAGLRGMQSKTCTLAQRIKDIEQSDGLSTFCQTPSGIDAAITLDETCLTEQPQRTPNDYGIGVDALCYLVGGYRVRIVPRDKCHPRQYVSRHGQPAVRAHKNLRIHV
ncbi:hypothetical protein P3T18_003089 [Paraburkholderia sp. GAS199]